MMVSTVILAAIFTILCFLLSKSNGSIPILKMLPTVFIIPIVASCLEKDLNKKVVMDLNKLDCILVYVTIVFCLFLFVNKPSIKRKLDKNLIWRGIKIFLVIITISVLLVLMFSGLGILDLSFIYGLQNKTLKDSGNIFIIITSVIAAYVALYGTQRTLKQELTKNRQAWINEVRQETAKIISTVDKIKLFCCIKDNSRKYSSKTLLMHYEALIESCTTLRMLLNPRDLVAPILDIQLDAIAQYISSQGWVKGDHSRNYIMLSEIDLRKSFMPWVQILLKIEWERVKATLESREEQAQGYYSQAIYEDDWNRDKFEGYGANLRENIINENGNEYEKKYSHLFPGFYFTENTQEKICKQLNCTIIGKILR